MNIRISCPNNPEHNLFTATAHVSESWVVDELGQFVDVEIGGGEIVDGPDFECSECVDCGADAVIEEG